MEALDCAELEQTAQMVEKLLEHGAAGGGGDVAALEARIIELEARIRHGGGGGGGTAAVNSTASPQQQQKQRVVIFGGTGFIGRHVSTALEAAGCTVVRASRAAADGGGIGSTACASGAGEQHLGTAVPRWLSLLSCTSLCARRRSSLKMPVGGAARTPGLHCDLTRPVESAVVAELRGCTAVVNCVGVKRPTSRQGWEAAHVTTVTTAVALCNAAGVGRLVHLSVAGLAAGQTDPYSVTKLAAEAVAIGAAAGDTGSGGLAVTVLRPGIVWGDGDDFSRGLAATVKHAPVFPRCWPSGKLAVVHVAAVAEAVAEAVLGRGPAGSPAAAGRPVIEVIEVVGKSALQPGVATHCVATLFGNTFALVTRRCGAAGPEEVGLSELVMRVADGLGLWCCCLPVPATVLAAAAWVMERLLHDPPVTTAQLHLLRRGVVGGGGGPAAGAAAGAAGVAVTVQRRGEPFSAEAVEVLHTSNVVTPPLFGLSLRYVATREPWNHADHLDFRRRRRSQVSVLAARALKPLLDVLLIVAGLAVLRGLGWSVT